jgi:hypothetical protein
MIVAEAKVTLKRIRRARIEIMGIASELPPLKTLHHIVNQQLAKIAEA